MTAPDTKHPVTLQGSIEGRVSPEEIEPVDVDLNRPEEWLGMIGGSQTLWMVVQNGYYDETSVYIPDDTAAVWLAVLFRHGRVDFGYGDTCRPKFYAVEEGAHAELLEAAGQVAESV
jgi:hypothetical protein